MSRKSRTPAPDPSSSNGTAWAFLVVSDPGQADTLPDQRAWAETVALSNGWRLTRYFEEVSTGLHGARSVLIDLIAALQALPPPERPERILMLRVDRLGRGDGLEAIGSFAKIRLLGVRIYTREPGGDVAWDDANDLLSPVVRILLGGIENGVRRDRASAVYVKRRNLKKTDPVVAIGSIAPYGLQLINGRYALKPPESEAVRFAFELRLQGYGHHLIAKKLPAIAPPWQLKNGTSRDRKWSSDRVARLIKNPNYRGTLIDEATWVAAQRNVREVRRPTIKNNYPLGGALGCECGYRLVGHAGPGSENCPWHYYQCRNYDAHGKMKHHRSDQMEKQFIELLDRLRAEDGLLERYVTGSVGDNRKALMSRLSELKTKVTGIAERRRRIFDAFEGGNLDQSDLQWRLNDLRAEEEALSSTARAVEEELMLQRALGGTLDYARDLVARAADHWQAASIDDQRALAKSIATALGGLVVSVDGELRVANSPAAIPVDVDHGAAGQSEAAVS